MKLNVDLKGVDSTVKHLVTERCTNAVVTTGRRCHEQTITRAKAISERWNLPYVPRERRSIAHLRKDALHVGVSSRRIVVVENERVTLHMEDDSSFYYHPGMGVNRVRRIMKGSTDWMIQAMELSRGDRILDCTVGLGSDLFVASFVVGDEGVAVGLESQLLTALIVHEGKQTYVHDHHDEMTRSVRRMRIHHADYTTYLPDLGKESYDVVYFDPMFVQPLHESHQMKPIRKLANAAPLKRSHVDVAMNVAKKRVVVKDRRDGPYAKSGWFDDIVGGRASPIVFCIAKK